jgi:hypothetical protein
MLVVAHPGLNRIIVSIPIDLTSDPNDADLAKLEEKGTKGRYCSVERLTETEHGKVEWRCVSSEQSNCEADLRDLLLGWLRLVRLVGASQALLPTVAHLER